MIFSSRLVFLLWFFAVLAGDTVSAVGFPVEKVQDLRSEKIISLDFQSARKGTVVVFLSSRCPCSRSHEKELVNLHEAFAKQGIRFVAFHSNADEVESADRLYFKDQRFKFVVVDDHQSIWANRFGAMKTPHAFVLNSKGEIVYTGAVSDARDGESSQKFFLREVLEDVVSQRKPRHDKTLSIGCMIRRPS